MRKAPGYVKIHRSLLDWEWYHDDRCVRLLLHLNLMANYEPGRWKGNDVSPGQVVTSSMKLADQLGWSRSCVVRTLDKLKACAEADTKSDSKWTLVTLLKWDKMQGEAPKPDSKPNRKRTGSGHQIGQQPDTIEEGKEREEGKNILFSASRFAQIETAKAELPELVAEGVDLEHYRDAIRNWSDTKSERRTERGWLATYRQWTKSDRDKGQLRKVKSTKHNPRA